MISLKLAGLIQRMKKYKKLPEKEPMELKQRCVHMPMKVVKDLDAVARRRSCSFSFVVRELIHEAMEAREFERLKKKRRDEAVA